MNTTAQIETINNRIKTLNVLKQRGMGEYGYPAYNPVGSETEAMLANMQDALGQRLNGARHHLGWATTWAANPESDPLAVQIEADKALIEIMMADALVPTIEAFLTKLGL